jgi:hypothetical protein
MVAISGIIFSLLFIICLVLIRLAIPVAPKVLSEWLGDAGSRKSIRLALNLVPFTGTAFLWFMAVLRNRGGLLEDRFFATVFLGSGFLFVTMLFANAAVVRALLDNLIAEEQLPPQRVDRAGHGTSCARDPKRNWSG